MIIQKLKKLLCGICISITLVLTTIGGYSVYRYFKPIPTISTETRKMRIKLEAIGIIKVAESEQTIKRDLIKGKSKFYRNRSHMSLTYKCFYEYDLSDIVIISEINEKSVVMEIDTTKLILSDLILMSDDSFNVSTIISPIIYDDEIAKIKNSMKLEILDEFKDDVEFKKLAIKSLKEKLYNLASDLGFEKIEILIKE